MDERRGVDADGKEAPVFGDNADPKRERDGDDGRGALAQAFAAGHAAIVDEPAYHGADSQVWPYKTPYTWTEKGLRFECRKCNKRGAECCGAYLGVRGEKGQPPRDPNAHPECVEESLNTSRPPPSCKQSMSATAGLSDVPIEAMSHKAMSLKFAQPREEEAAGWGDVARLLLEL